MMLACGPYFEPGGLILSAGMLLVIKPLSYFAFIQAFRYRVAREIPMTLKQAVGLTVLRTLVGVLFIGGGTFVFARMSNGAGLLIPWLYLIVSRVVAWWVIGRYAAQLRGRRLAAWIIFGTLINIAFDAAMAIGLFANLYAAVGVLVLITGTIYGLHATGTRAELRSRFYAHPICTICEYNLTGNLSGICPECGTPIQPVPTSP